MALEKVKAGFLGAGIGAGLGAIAALVLWLVLRENKSTKAYHEDVAKVGNTLLGSSDPSTSALGIEILAAQADVRDVTWEEVVVPGIVGIGLGIGAGAAAGIGAASLGVGLLVGFAVAAVVTGLLIWGFQAWDKRRLEVKLKEAATAIPVTVPAVPIAEPSSRVEPAPASSPAEPSTERMKRRDGLYVVYSPPDAGEVPI